MPARIYEITSPISGKAWDDARGAAGFIGGTCRLLLPIIQEAAQDARGVLMVEAAAVAFAKLTTLDEANGEKISDAYWKANEAFKRLRPLVCDVFWHAASPPPSLASSRLGSPGPASTHAIQASTVAAAFIQFAAQNNPGGLPWQQREQNDRLGVIVTEAARAGITKAQLLRQEWIWRFFACGGRMPLTEQLLLAFQAAWEIGHYDFARSIARQGFGELTSEQAAMLDK